MAIDASYKFGKYQLDPVQGVLFAQSDPIHLRPLTCELLRAFVKSPQETLSAGYLIREVWNDDTIDKYMERFGARQE